MAFELAAARILAPTIGSSTYVWTSVIGVIIAALSIGYWVGGRMADARKRPIDVVALLLLTSVSIALCLLIYSGTLEQLASFRIDVRLQAVLAALLLFAPASFLLGTISPYLVKLNVRSLAHSGRSVADLSAMNSIGGILGTFLTGFVLFSYMGSRETIALVTVLLLISSWCLIVRTEVIKRIVFSVIILGLLGIGLVAPQQAGRVSIDTASAHYEVIDIAYGNTLARGLMTGPGGIQSAVRLDGSKEPVFWYTQELARLTLEAKPSSILVLGGGTFTLPEYLAQELPDTTIDVVEIDPRLEEIATEYFMYDSPENVNLIFSDARTYVNQSTKEYDVIIADVYGDSSIPFSLITKEYGEAVSARLSPDGIVLANIIGGIYGPCRDVFDAANSVYLNQLEFGAYSINPDSTPDRANIIARYSNNREDTPLGLRTITPPEARPYTDNFVPAERLHFACESVRS